MKDLDLREVLKNAPKGTKLYSTAHGYVEFETVNSNDSFPITCHKGIQLCLFTKEGKYYTYDDGECVLFPSKENKDWSKFELPCQFKIGDILTSKDGVCIAIFNKSDFIPTGKNHNVLYYNCWCSPRSGFFKFGIDYGIGRIDEYRYATETEKNILFDKLQEEGYFWNGETKSLEKYKFEVGHCITTTGEHKHVITQIKHNKYIVTTDDKYLKDEILCACQENFNFYQGKFDITTLKPYDKVLTRRSSNSIWIPQLFSCLDSDLKDYCNKFVVVGGCSVKHCIPYEGNEHLIGTTNDCDEFYKTWE